MRIEEARTYTRETRKTNATCFCFFYRSSLRGRRWAKSIFEKQKGALKAHETARTKEDKVFVKTLQTFTGSSKTPHFKTFWKKLDKPIKW